MCKPAEALMMLAGLALTAYSARRVMVGIEGETARLTRLSAWALMLALPYFLTFFFSYSYHYRLGFAILPLLCLPIAIALSRIINRERMRAWSAGWRRLYAILLTLLCLPGVIAVMTDVSWSLIWLLRDDLNSDFKKYEFYNPSLMQVAARLGRLHPRVHDRSDCAGAGRGAPAFLFPAAADSRWPCDHVRRA